MEQLLISLVHGLPKGDFFLTLPFWGCFAAAALIYRMAPPRPALKGWLLLGTNVCMLLTLPQFNLVMLGTLGGLCLFAYGIAARLNSGRATSQRRRWWWAVAGIVGIVCVLAFFKYTFIQDFVRRPKGNHGLAASDFIFLIGISYSSFKAMHYVIEGYKGAIADASLLGFLNYVLFFPAYISGPINRFNHFCENSDTARKATLREDLGVGWQRIVHGLFKKVVLVTALAPYTILSSKVPVSEMSFLQLLLGLYVQALFFYFDFSGYSDLAIGTGRIMGFVLPENFNFPFFKKNIQQFWANWHISLTTWLTDYVYWPLVRRLRNGEFFRKHPILLSNSVIIITFALCGIWHGNALNFMFWGVYQGVGIAAVNTYQSWKRKVRNPLARRYFTSPYSRALGLVATFNFFALGQSLFVLNGEQLKHLAGRML